MKYVIIFLYWLITWLIKYLINVVEFIWHLDVKNLSYYNTHFLSVSQIKEYKPNMSVTKEPNALNIVQRLVYYCAK